MTLGLNTFWRRGCAKAFGCAALAALLSAGDGLRAAPSDTTRHLPEIHATIRGKYEFEPSICKGRFEIRNARVALQGSLNRTVGYKAEIDLSDEGQIKMLDAYVSLQPIKRLKITVGQMRVPFTIDAHRSPHLQYFANRSFIAKQVGNVRDVGATVSYTAFETCPLTLEAGIFNGSGLTDLKEFWTSSPNFAFKAQTSIGRHFYLTAGFQRANAGDTKTDLYNAGLYFNSERWHIEAEYLRKKYVRTSFPSVNAANAFAVYRLPLKKAFSAISFLARYDYMSDHSKGLRDENGRLTVDDPARHRLTGGITLSLGSAKLQADIRLNYEQYFYRAGAQPLISEQSKAVIEFVCHF